MATTLAEDTFRPGVYPRLPRIPDLDRRTYIQNMEVLAHFEPGERHVAVGIDLVFRG